MVIKHSARREDDSSASKWAFAALAISFFDSVSYYSSHPTQPIPHTALILNGCHIQMQALKNIYILLCELLGTSSNSNFQFVMQF